MILIFLVLVFLLPLAFSSLSLYVLYSCGGHEDSVLVSLDSGVSLVRVKLGQNQEKAKMY